MSRPQSSTTRRRRATAAVAASTLAFSGAAFFGAGPSSASSHREAPLIIGDPALDTTDLYSFVSPDRPGYVTLIANVSPFQDPAGGPNFYPFATNARYNIKIDNNGDAKPDITYRFTFKTQDLRGTNTFLYNNGPVTSLTDENLLFRQTYTLEEIPDAARTKVLVKDAPVAPSRVGDASMPDYAKLRAEAVTSFAGGGKAFAGQADDPFFIDLRVFDLLYGANLSETGDDTLTGKNVNTMAIQVPISSVTKGKDPVIGVHATTDRPSVQVTQDGKQNSYGSFVQVSRLGNPLVNEVVVPAGLKDAFNALPPVKDATIPAIVARVTDPEVPKLIEAFYGIPAPKTPRNDLVSVFLTGVDGLNKPKGKVRPSEQLRLNTSIPASKDPSRLGVLGQDLAGFPNGRRLTDDVVDIGVQALEGAVVSGIVPELAAGDAVDANDMPFGTSFPYVALPTSGSTTVATAGVAPASATLGADVALASNSSDQGSPLLPVSLGLLGAGLMAVGAGLFRRSRSQS